MSGDVEGVVLPSRFAEGNAREVHALDRWLRELLEIRLIEDAIPRALLAHPSSHCACVPLAAWMRLVEAEAEGKLAALGVPDGLHEFIGGGPQALFDRRISKFAGNL
jgi:hypothetical protein